MNIFRKSHLLSHTPPVLELSGPGLGKNLAVLQDLIPRNEPIVYFDYPVHDNVGDLLIHYATEKFFVDHGYRIAAAFSWRATGWRTRVIPKNATIVFHGGGNLGDLYPAHEHLRHAMLARYPHNRAVILPQSVYFSDAELRKHTLSQYAKYPNLTICVRDHESEKLLAGGANELNCLLLPDMAHHLENHVRVIEPEQAGAGDLYFLRTDKESRIRQTMTPEEVHAESNSWDWSRLVDESDRRRINKHNDRHKRAYDIGLNFYPYRRWVGFRNELVTRALRLFQRHSRVYTDRLHGGILAMLCGKPVVLFDNNNAKIQSYYSTWLRDYDRVQLKSYNTTWASSAGPLGNN